MDDSSNPPNGPAPDASPFQSPPSTDAAATVAPPPQPLREDQIQNAISFLTHPRVKSSPAATKRSFLERKGLTAAEIDEAFKRVPDTSPAADTTPPTAPAPGMQQQQYTPANTSQYAPSAAQPQQQYPNHPQHTQTALVPHQPQQAAVEQPQGYRWTQVVLGAGVLAAGIFLVKHYVVPYAADLYNNMVSHSRKQAEEQRKRDEALTEALQAMQRSQDDLRASMTAVTELARSLKDSLSTQQQEAPVTTTELRRELMTLSASLAALGAGRSAADDAGRSSEAQQLRSEVAELRGALKRMMLNSSTSQQQQGSASPAARPGSSGPFSTTHHTNGTSTYPTYSGPSYGRSVDTFPADAAMYSSHFGGGSGSYGDSFGQVQQQRAGAGARGPGRAMTPQQDGSERDEAPHSQAFYEVMEMVAKGITPPNVRTDINDSPPDPSKPLPEPKMAARPKPWGARAQEAAARGNFPAFDQPGFGAPIDTSAGLHHASSLDPGAPEWLPPASPAPSQQEQAVAEAAAGAAAGAAVGVGKVAGYVAPRVAGWRPPPPPQPTISGSSKSLAGGGEGGEEVQQGGGVVVEGGGSEVQQEVQ